MARRLLLRLAAASLAALSAAAPGAAQLTTSEGASILFFPLIAAGADRDTVVQLANGTAHRTFVRCVYTQGNAGGAEEDLSFELVLNARHPTHWTASTGRLGDPNAPPCQQGQTACDGAGLDPGRIPPLPADFRGDLLCIELDRSRAPHSGNALRGTATLIDTDSGDVAKYAAAGLPGLAANDGDDSLCLGGEVRENCPRGAEYGGCPARWFVQHRVEGAPTSVAEQPTAQSGLIIETCSRRAGTGGATVALVVTNELEQRFVASLAVQRWSEVRFADQSIFAYDLLGTEFAQTELRSIDTPPGIVVLALSRNAGDAGEAAGGSRAEIPHADGVREGPDRIVVADQ